VIINTLPRKSISLVKKLVKQCQKPTQAKFVKKALNKPLRVAVIGTGKAAKYHLHVLSNIDGVDVACIVNRGRSDPNPLMEQYSIAESYTDINQAIDNWKIDAAIVAVTPGSTFEVSKALIDNNISCLIEKPLGVTIQEATALKLLASQKECILAVGYNRRFYSSVLAAYDYTQAIGRPYSIHIEAPEDIVKQLRNKNTEDVKNRLISSTTHAIDLFTLFAGEHEDVSGIEYAKYYDGIQADFMSFIRFQNIGTGSFISHWRSPGDWTVSLYGDNYKLIIDLFKNKLLRYQGKNKELVDTSNGFDGLFKPGVYLQNYNFLTCIINQKQPEPVLASINDAFQSLKLANDIITTSWGRP